MVEFTLTCWPADGPWYRSFDLVSGVWSCGVLIASICVRTWHNGSGTESAFFALALRPEGCFAFWLPCPDLYSLFLRKVQVRFLLRERAWVSGSHHSLLHGWSAAFCECAGFPLCPNPCCEMIPDVGWCLPLGGPLVLAMVVRRDNDGFGSSSPAR